MSNVVEFVDTDFPDNFAKGVVLVDFWAEWCSPCNRLAPTINALSDKYDGQVTVAKMDVDKNPETFKTFGIKGIPTVVILEDGEIRDKITGLQPQETFEKVLDSIIEGQKGLTNPE